MLYHVGGRMPLHSTGVGLSCSPAHRPPCRSGSWATSPPIRPARTRQTPQKLRRVLADVRHSGFATVTLTVPWPRTSVAAPPLGFGGKVYAALSVVMPRAAVDHKDDERRSSRDLFCTAAAPGDATARVEIEGLLSAPTSRPLCHSCALPPADLVCSHLLHPQVTSVTDAGGIKSRDVVSALCDRGQKEVEEPEGCTAGGHSCWQRRVEVKPVRPARLPPLSVPEAFDVTDLAWRLAFGQRERFRGKPGSMKNTASLAVDCADLEEFESRMSALADVIDQIWPGDALLPADIDVEKASRSLDRLTEVLRHRLPASQQARVEEAVSALRRIRQVRNALQHSRTRGGLLAALRNLGVHDASPSWDDTWNIVRAQTVDALKILREELVQFSETSEIST
ncbi:hypothetical protein GCM10027610_023510 [Dactylosporangium cerinum]